ncbi:unnamed protein product, partial [Closterium sp. NIES-54]
FSHSRLPRPRSPAPPCTPCVEGRQRAAPHSSSFPPTTAPFQTLHLDVWGPSLVLGPRQESYFLIVVDDYSRYTTVFPLRRKADVPTVLEPWLLARGGAQALCGLDLHSDHGGEFSSTRLETFCQGRGIIQSYTLPASPQQNGVAERRIGLVMEVARTSMCHASAPQFLWPQAVRYAALQLNLWPGDTRPRVAPVSLWTGSPSVAANFRSPRPPPPPPPSRPAPSVVSYVTPRSPPPQHPVPVVSGGAKGAAAEGEGAGAAGAGGVGSRGAGGVGVEVTPVEDTAASTRRPRPASPPGFPSVPHFPPHSSLRPVVAELGGVPTGGIGGPVGVGGGGAGSGGARAGGTGIVAPRPCTGTAPEAAVAAAAEATPVAAAASVTAAVESRGGVPTAAAGAVAVAAGAVAAAAGESRGVMATPGEGRAGVPPASAGAVTGTAGESRGGVTAVAGEGSARFSVTAAGAAAAAAGEGRGGATGAAAGAGTVAADAKGGGAAATATARLAQPSTCTLGSCRAVSPEPHRSRYRADGLFHLVLRSRVPPPSVLPQPPESSLTVLHELLFNYLRASRPVVSRVLSALVTHPTAPLSSVSALVTTITGFASSHRLDYAAHLVSGPARSPSSGGTPVFPLEVLEDRQFELGFLAAAVPHLCAMLLALEGDPNALDIPIPRTHAEAVSRPWASY